MLPQETHPSSSRERRAHRPTKLLFTVSSRAILVGRGEGGVTLWITEIKFMNGKVPIVFHKDFLNE